MLRLYYKILESDLLLFSYLYIQTTCTNNIKLQNHTALVLTIIDIIVPGIAPTTKENVSIVKIINFFMESLLFSSSALNNNCPTVLRFPVHMVVLYAIPRQFLNKHNRYPIKKETRLVTIRSGTDLGNNPMQNSAIDSKIRPIFLQSPK